jgi:monofunctional biosynthetic peptidoglycan transglycosylase
MWALVVFVLLTALPVLAIRWWDPFSSAFMLQARLEAVDDKESYRTRYQWVDMDRISPQAALAVVASEDQLFPVHYGFDLKSIQKAVLDGDDGKPMRGASTISQQVAKNLFLWPGRSLVRKGLEAWFTVLLETLWPKKRILEVYLNIAEFGHGTYGVEAAARRFFNKPASGINASEAALLAAVLPSPRRLRVDRPSPYVISRQQWIMDQMRALGGRSYLRDLRAATSGTLRPARLV